VADPFNLRPGDTFAEDFVVVRDVSRGGMGVVYHVKQISTDRPRALKVMLSEVVGDLGLRKRFEQEARIGARIESDHVVEVVAAGVDTDSGVPWLAMELLDGRNLADALTERKMFQSREVLSIFEKICHAVGAAHRVGIVHRDLKPENIFLAKTRRVGEEYTVKVLDFGLAKLVAEAKTRRTAAVGSPKWMAPEQTDGSEISPETDVWALGLIAFKMLTGAYYWKSANRDEVTIPQLMREILFGDLPLASIRAAEIGDTPPLPAGFDAWFGRCVARSRSERFANADLALENVRRVLSSVDREIAPHAQDAESPSAPSPALPPERTDDEDAVTELPMSRDAADTPSSGRPEGTANAQRVGNGRKPTKKTRRWISIAMSLGAIGTGALGFSQGMRLVTGKPYEGPRPPTSTSSAPAAPVVAASKTTPIQRNYPAPCPPGMAFLPRGTYAMGERKDVVSVQPFCMDITEVTVAAFGNCVSASACAEPSAHKTDDPTNKFSRGCNWKRASAGLHPVNCVDWNQANAYCAWAGKRLPSEEEWEWAARSADAGRSYPWGDGPPSADRVNACGTECVKWARENLAEDWSPTYPADDGWPTTAPVGSFPRGATEQGLEDMAGNVWEWTSGALDSNTRVARGGNWGFDLAVHMRASARGGRESSLRSKFGGFRCAR
jgi:serine/threonine protein kinase/formylglycine-generating enzyme required for sulfatase activity